MQYMFSVAPIDVTRPTMMPAKPWSAGMEPAGGPAARVPVRAG